MKRVWKSLLMMSVAFIVPTVLLADSITMEDVVSSIDTMWTLLAAFLVFLCKLDLRSWKQGLQDQRTR